MAFSHGTGYSSYALQEPCGTIAIIDPAGQAALAEFVEVWADNLTLQGWTTRATVVYRQPPENEDWTAAPTTPSPIT